LVDGPRIACVWIPDRVRNDKRGRMSKIAAAANFFNRPLGAIH
jgi:hypothetical protein